MKFFSSVAESLDRFSEIDDLFCMDEDPPAEDPPAKTHSFFVPRKLQNKCVMRIMYPNLKEIEAASSDPRIREKVKVASKTILDLLRGAGSFRCPLSDFSKEVRPLDIYKKAHQVYCIIDENGKIVKFGYSGNLQRRYKDKPEMLERCVVVVSSRTISPELDKRIVEIVDELLTDICNDESLPYDLRRLFHLILHRGGHEIGLKKTIYFQLIEIGCQYEYNTGVISEVFATGEKTQKERRQWVKDTTGKWISSKYDDLEKFVGRPVMMMSTWATGMKEGLLSSQVVANEYVADGDYVFVNAMPIAVYPNSSKMELVYFTDWTLEEIRKGRQRVYDKIQEAIDNGGVLFLAKNQEKLFPGDYKLANVLENKFEFKATFAIGNGKVDRIMSFTHSSGNSKVILYCPLGFSMDSRKETIKQLPLKLRTYLDIEVLRNVSRFLHGKECLFGTSNGDDSLTAAFFYESILKTFHGHRFVAAAAARDALTPDHVFACEQNNLRKILQVHTEYMCQQARNKYRNKPTKCPLEANIVLVAATMVCNATEETLLSVLETIHEMFLYHRQRETATTITRGTRWKSLLERYLGEKGTRLRDLCEEYVALHFKENDGNRLAYKPVDHDDNDELFTMLWDTQSLFWVMGRTPKTEAEHEFDPSHDEYADLRKRIFGDRIYCPPANFVLQGIKERKKNRPKQCNTNARKAAEMAGERGYGRHLTVFCFLDDSGRKPIIPDMIVDYEEPEGSTPFHLGQFHKGTFKKKKLFAKVDMVDWKQFKKRKLVNPFNKAKVSNKKAKTSNATNTNTNAAATATANATANANANAADLNENVNTANSNRINKGPLDNWLNSKQPNNKKTNKSSGKSSIQGSLDKWLKKKN